MTQRLEADTVGLFLLVPARITLPMTGRLIAVSGKTKCCSTSTHARMRVDGEIQMTRFLFAIAVAALSTSASAQTIYKCVINGRAVFQESPCASGSSTIISNRPAPPAGTPRPVAPPNANKSKAPASGDDDPAVVDKSPYDPSKT